MAIEVLRPILFHLTCQTCPIANNAISKGRGFIGTGNGGFIEIACKPTSRMKMQMTKVYQKLNALGKSVELINTADDVSDSCLGLKKK